MGSAISVAEKEQKAVVALQSRHRGNLARKKVVNIKESTTATTTMMTMQQEVPLDGKLHPVDGAPGWTVGRGFLGADDDFEIGTMTVKEAMATCEKCNAPCFTFNEGEIVPAGKIDVWIKGKKKSLCENSDWVTYCWSGAAGKEVKRPCERIFKLDKESVADGSARTCLSRFDKEVPHRVIAGGWGYLEDIGKDIRGELEKDGVAFVDPEFPPYQSSRPTH